MHELTCPSCGSAAQYSFKDYILLCPFCSASFRINPDSGRKDLFSDHYIVPNTMDAMKVKEVVMEWLRRIHHKPGAVDREYTVTNIKGCSIPYWVMSAEVHTSWRGLVQRQRRGTDVRHGKEFLVESGHFRRSYRWAVSARSNICEHWGLIRMHEPKERVSVVWDGFPLDSTFSRGRLNQPSGKEKTAYEIREYFEFKYANGLPIMSIQIPEEEAMRRAKNHVEWFHYNLAMLHADYLLDCRSELDIAGIQLLHLPFWNVEYVYRPNNMLRYFHKPVVKHVALEGVHGGLIKGELALVHRDKVMVNAVITGIAAVMFFLLGAAWNSAFFLVSLFFALVAGLSGYIAMVRLENSKMKSQLEEQSPVSEEPSSAAA